ncbi:hypothetical protein CP500_000305 [Tychonema bourrellyi FEM_GT703]|uniref:Uncharacterized protein n=1 Tax=Tychonema bourrellyi FEM_GT703 TaxID=2040638 RepID=A0A2G4F6R9_9CYAN|nr:hypothetical protein CP500_000305 [Tychonema bourrellyi FEM_GT703]
MGQRLCCAHSAGGGTSMNDVFALYETDYYLWLQETYQTLEKKERVKLIVSAIAWDLSLMTCI